MPVDDTGAEGAGCAGDGRVDLRPGMALCAAPRLRRRRGAGLVCPAPRRRLPGERCGPLPRPDSPDQTVRAWRQRADAHGLFRGVRAFLLSDFGFTLESLSGVYDSWARVPPESGWVIGFLLLGVRRRAPTALAARISARAGAPLHSGAAAADAADLIVGLIVVLALTDAFWYEIGDDLLLVGLCLVATGLVVARQFITISEGVMLNRELERSRAFSGAVLPTRRMPPLPVARTAR